MTLYASTEETLTREAYYRQREAEPATPPTLNTVEHQALRMLRRLNDAGEFPTGSALAERSATKGRIDTRDLLRKGWVKNVASHRGRALTITPSGRAALEES
jgi:DNA-binding MarR family transcriptional regulator